ncbi:hypothetical protein NEIELOOT_00460 [Neisseria elongata subsp. glycolytica ATCC 29315]|uniref:Uncharacterized protein n=1 Tax=Neisseria elongata subsp. glycolytica ATCC 29315 TaxID=546263 RepID=D4DN36_NEIEG|nr:hypothetical protein NEIELOOT_00460 [Neisseria elongata subsp. glycolytica ATCC 29315]
MVYNKAFPTRRKPSMDAYPEAEAPPQSIVELVPVLIAVTDGGLRVLTVAQGTLLPNGPLSPLRNSLQAGVKLWVAKQTSQPMGYVEQLYTFVDTHRRNEHGMPVLYVSYLGAGARGSRQHPASGCEMAGLLRLFPVGRFAHRRRAARRHRQPPAHLGKLGGHGGSPPKAAQAHSFVLGG